jgi:cytochrome c-type biogenesis protein CcmH
VTDISKALRELLLARAAGTIDAEEFERRQASLHAELLAQDAAATKTAGWFWAIGIVVIATAVGLYAWLGNSDKATAPTSAPLPTMSAAPMMSPAPMAPGDKASQPNSGGDLNAMAVRLAEKLAKNPTNGEGWALLAQTYVELRKYKEADQAFTKATSLGQSDAHLLTEWADAHVIANDRKWDKTARDILARALAADAKNLKALALSGSEAFERADYKQAIAQWKKLRAIAPADSMDAKLADSNIAEANLRLTGKTSAPQAAEKPAAGGGAVAGTVSIDPVLKSKVAPTDTVFVIARAVEGGGMPLAVRRYTVADLPVIFSLSDDDAMSPERSLSHMGAAVLIARISKSGDAVPQPTDITSAPVNAKTGATNVKLELKAQ